MKPSATDIERCAAALHDACVFEGPWEACLSADDHAHDAKAVAPEIRAARVDTLTTAARFIRDYGQSYGPASTPELIAERLEKQRDRLIKGAEL